MSKATASCEKALLHTLILGPVLVAKEVDSALLGTAVTHQDSWK